jgi:hypothetical protein
MRKKEFTRKKKIAKKTFEIYDSQATVPELFIESNTNDNCNHAAAKCQPQFSPLLFQKSTFQLDI